MKTHRFGIWLGVVALLMLTSLLVVGCSTSGDDDDDSTNSSYNPDIDPGNFTNSTTIENPYLSWVPGTTWIYKEESEDGIQDNLVEVTHNTKTIMGIECVEVHDTVSMDGELLEDTLDYYAQDNDGNVWYFGEDTAEYENGQLSTTEGSWTGGVDGAKPGIIMEADPQIGDTYRQEYLAGEAEDMAEVLSLDASVTVAYGSFDHCLKTKEWTPLEPDVVENKYNCTDVHGVVKAVTVQGDTDQEELIDITTE